MRVFQWGLLSPLSIPTPWYGHPLWYTPWYTPSPEGTYYQGYTCQQGRGTRYTHPYKGPGIRHNSPCGQTHACENIMFLHVRWREANKIDPQYLQKDKILQLVRDTKEIRSLLSGFDSFAWWQCVVLLRFSLSAANHNIISFGRWPIMCLYFDTGDTPTVFQCLWISLNVGLPLRRIMYQ